MSAPRDHVLVVGSKIDVTLIPTWGEPSWPPTTRTRPSASVTWPAQWVSPNGAGVAVNSPVVGFHTRACEPCDQTSTLPLCSSTLCLPCTPQSSTGPHCPTWSGGPSTAKL